MRIGILTITPNIGFGGNLQAYALKSVLEKMGHQVSIIQYTRYHVIKQRIKFLLKNLYKILTKGEYACLSFKDDYEFRRQKLRKFHSISLNFTQEVNTPKKLHKLINDSFDSVVVGSDQVWRPKYVNGVENYFFKGVKNEISKIAYSASFGVDLWEFTEAQTAECRKLLQNFKYVSVREKTGIDLVREKLDYKGKVYCDLDPTLLADKSIYTKFIKEQNANESYVFSYILDKNPSKRDLVSLVGQNISTSILDFNTNAENSNVALKDRVAPAIEDWISGIYYSKFVVTDSFHGCVFSIIFNKPFIVYMNRQRGAERFRSLLTDFGLLDRIWDDEKTIDKSIFTDSIDWDSINAKLIAKRTEIYSRLKNAFI